MLSRRTALSLVPNALARVLEARRAAGRAVIDLTASNPTAAELDYPGEAILQALGRPEALRYAPTPRGLAAARRAVADYYAARGAAVDPAHVVLTASTSEGYSHLFTCLADPGDALLAPAPSYPLLEHLAALAAVRLVPYPLTFDGRRWRADTEALADVARAEPLARAVVVVSPNNPTGSMLSRDELAAIDAVCRRHGLALVADEVFADYAEGDDPGRSPTLAAGVAAALGRRGDDPAAPLAFALNGLSKVAGLPQLKLGWIAASGPPRRLDAALERLDLVADAFLSVASPVQAGLADLLGLAPTVRDQIRARVAANRARLASLAAGSPCRVLPAEGGWYAVVEVPRLRDEEALVLALLGQDDVLVHPGFFFDFPREAFLVVSLLPPTAVFARGAERVVARASAGD
jgi:aspartate/methionine/tyrosine aminotransferase